MSNKVNLEIKTSTDADCDALLETVQQALLAYSSKPSEDVMVDADNFRIVVPCIIDSEDMFLLAEFPNNNQDVSYITVYTAFPEKYNSGVQQFAYWGERAKLRDIADDTDLFKFIAKVVEDTETIIRGAKRSGEFYRLG